MDTMSFINMANNCLGCKEPTCQKACPLGLEIPEIMKRVKNYDTQGAKKLIEKKQALPFLCGYLCDHEKQCEGHCVKNLKGNPVEIGNVEAILGLSILNDEMDIKNIISKPYKVAIIGGGPCGLACSYFLLKAGIKVTIFDKEKQLGGIVTKLLPNFRYEELFIYKFINKLIKMGLEVKTEMTFGENLQFDDLKGYKDLVLTIGASKSKSLFAAHSHVLNAFEVLDEKNHKTKKYDFKGKKVIIIGGGNVAYDTARSLLRLFAQVTICYRRDILNSPGNQKEIKIAKKEGVKIKECLAPKELLLNGSSLDGIRFEKTILEKGEGERLNFKGTKKYLDLPCDYVIEAIGNYPDYTYLNNAKPQLFDNEHHLLVSDDYLTKDEHLYVGGDFVTGPKTFVSASKAGYDIANIIINKVNKEKR